MHVGADRLSPVRHDAKGEFAFEGVLKQVVVEIFDSRVASRPLRVIRKSLGSTV